MSAESLEQALADVRKEILKVEAKIEGLERWRKVLLVLKGTEANLVSLTSEADKVMTRGR